MKHCANDDCEHLAANGRRAEFLDAVEICSDCGAPLVHGDAPAPQSDVDYQELATVYETSDRVQAHLMRSLLDDAGIPAHVSGDALQGAMGELPLTMLSIRIQVPAESAEEARRIVLEADRSAS